MLLPIHIITRKSNITFLPDDTVDFIVQPEDNKKCHGKVIIQPEVAPNVTENVIVQPDDNNSVIVQ